MASIPELTGAQCQQLQGVHIGSLILIESLPKQQDEYISDDENEDEDGEQSESDDESSDGEQDDKILDDGQTSVAAEHDDMNGAAAVGAHDVQDEHMQDGQQGSATIEAAVGSETVIPTAGVDDGAESEDQDQSDAGQSDVYQPLPSHLQSGVYVIAAIFKDDNEAITDILLEELRYCSNPSNKDTSYRSYHMYGTEIKASSPSKLLPRESNDVTKVSIKNLDNGNRDNTIYICYDADDVCSVMFQGQCPVHCNEGWLPNQATMHALVTEPITTVTEHMPVCPVCIGKPLMQEYQALREMLESGQGGMIDFGTLVEFHGRLNPRRTQLGYEFKQFDEREWGYMFDDMQSEDDGSDAGAGGGNNAGWGYWDEALDPSSCIVTKPASESAIANLPRHFFEDVKSSETGTECLICKDAFMDETIVAELPCSHVFCDGGCISSWLQQFNTCPICRLPLPSKNDEQDSKMVNGNANSSTGNANSSTGNNQVEDTNEQLDNGAEVEMDADLEDDNMANGHGTKSPATEAMIDDGW